MSTSATCSCQRPIEPAPVFVPTVEAMADAMRIHHANCTEDLLRSLGFPLSFQRENKDKAVALANRGFVRSVAAAPARSVEAAEKLAVTVIEELLPDTQRIVAELQARNLNKREIDLVLRNARAKAALNFARGQVH